MLVLEAVPVVELPVHKVSLNKVDVVITDAAVPVYSPRFIRALRQNVPLQNNIRLLMNSIPTARLTTALQPVNMLINHAALPAPYASIHPLSMSVPSRTTFNSSTPPFTLYTFSPGKFIKPGQIGCRESDKRPVGT